MRSPLAVAWIGGACVFLESILFTALVPLLPHFRSAYGLSRFAVGALVAAYAVGVVAGSFAAVAAAVRVDYRTLVCAGLVVLAASTTLFALASSYPVLLLARIAQGCGGATCWIAVLAWVAAGVAADARGAAAGVIVGCAVAGGLAGPVVGAAATAGGVRTVFLVLAALAVVAAPAARRAGLLHPVARRPSAPAWRRRRLSGALAPSVWPLCVGSTFLGFLAALAPLALSDAGLTGAQIGWTFAAAAGLEASLHPLVGRWSDRRGRRLPIGLGLASAAAVALAIPWLRSAWLVVVVLAAAVPLALLISPSMALVADSSERLEVDHAVGAAIVNLAFAPGFVLGPLAGAAAARALGDAGAWSALAAVCAATAAAGLARRDVGAL